MQSASRRAFLQGRRRANTPWGRFCQRISRVVEGKFLELEGSGDVGVARLTAASNSDIYHALALCQEYEVRMALHGLSFASSQGCNTLWVSPGSGLGGYQRLQGHGSRWFVQPGCTLGTLVQAGLDAFTSLPPDKTIASWLADRTLSDFAPNNTWQSGIEHAKLLLGDGSSISLGPFGRDNTKPLEGRRVQELIPALFSLSGLEQMQSFANADFWPMKYRLDALLNNGSKHGMNLAQILPGHGGDLGWVEWLVINAEHLDPDQGLEFRYSTELLEQSQWCELANGIDAKIKRLFDPDNVFTVNGQVI